MWIIKYTEKQKKAIKDGHILNFKVNGKDIEQIALQEMIDNHYYKEPEEKYETFESKLNNQ